MESEHAPLDILFRDAWIVAVDKPAGQLVHPAENPQEGDQVTMKILRDQIGEQVHLIHRLDRPTSGVLLMATDREAARDLHLAFENHQIEKTYWAIVLDHPTKDAWSCTQPIRKTEESAERSAETSFRVLKRLPHDLALIEAKPSSGRFHQIRRHLVHSGHPIVGDYRYTGVDTCDRLGKQLGTGTRMLLQAKNLKFTHPITGKPISVEAQIDPNFEKVLCNPLSP